jgi:hypothetical protein
MVENTDLAIAKACKMTHAEIRLYRGPRFHD